MTKDGGVGDIIDNVNNIFFKYVLVPQKSTRNWIKINKNFRRDS